MGSKGSNTTTTNSAPSPQAQALIGNATKAARSAYDWGMQYNPVNWKGELVAPVNQQQYQGIAGINQYANAAQPMVNMAEGWIQQAAQPITAQNIQQYMDPFTNQVIQATQADFANQNAIQRQGVVGNAIAQGAFGGNREAIAEAELAHQQASAQDPIIAQLRSQGYQTGVNTALTEQQNRANQAYGLANVAGSGQNLGLTGANAMIGAGGLEQGTQQALDTALLNKYMMTGAYPMQLAQAQAGIELPAASYEGGTSSTTGPPPSMFSQIAGLGTAGLGLFGSTGAIPYMFGNRGGAVKGYDSGGFVDADPYIKTVNIPGGPGPPKPPSAPSKPAQSPLQGLGSLGTALGGKGGLVPALGSAFSSGITSLGEAMPEVGAALADAAPFVGLALNRGGNVHGYDDGGVVTPNPDSTGMLPYSKPQGIYPLQYPSFKTNIPNVNIPHGSGIPKPPSIQGQSQNDLNNQAKQIGSLTKAIMGDRSQSAQDAAQDAEQDAAEDARRGGGIHGYAEGGAPPDLYYDPLASQSGVVRVPTEIGIHDYNDTDTDNNGIGYNPDFSFSNLPASDPAGIKSDASIKYRENPAHQSSINLADKLAGEPGRTDDIPTELPPLPAKTIPTKFRDDPDVPEDYARARSPFSQLTSYADDRRRPVAEQPKAKGLSGMFSGVDLSGNSKLWPALMAAGFGMMASRSPFAGVGIGEGGQQGVQTYNQLSEQEKKHDLTQQQIDQRSKQLSQQADEFNRKLEEQSKERMLKLMEPRVMGMDRYKNPIYGRQDASGKLFNLDGTPYDDKKNAQENEIAQSTGEDYLKTLPSEEAAYLRKVRNYDAALPTQAQAGTRNPIAAKMRDDFYHAYPTEYNEAMYPIYSRAKQQFFSGPRSDTIRSFNVSISHLDSLQKAMDALEHGDYPAANALLDWYKRETGKAAPTNATAVRNIVADEITKAVIGSRGALSDREATQDTAAIRSSPEQAHGVIDKYKELMSGQLMGFKQQFTSTTNMPGEIFDNFLMPNTRQQLMYHEKSGAGVPQRGVPTVNQEAFKKLPSGAQFIAEGDPTQTVRTKP